MKTMQNLFVTLITLSVLLFGCSKGDELPPIKKAIQQQEEPKQEEPKQEEPKQEEPKEEEPKEEEPKEEEPSIKTILLETLTSRCWDIPQENPAYLGASCALFGMFAPEENAKRYSVKYINESAPHLSFTIAWDAGQPVPERVLIPAIPEYQNGMIDGMFAIGAIGNGCQSGQVENGCEVGTDRVNDLEEGLIELGGSMEITIELEN